MMTQQQALDKSAAHLLRQGERADMRGDGAAGELACVYRAPDGRMCAIGCLIPDHNYHPEMENKDIRTLFDTFWEDMLDAGLDDEHMTFYSDLQLVHDTYEPAQWVGALDKLAHEFGLQPPPALDEGAGA